MSLKTFVSMSLVTDQIADIVLLCRIPRSGTGSDRRTRLWYWSGRSGLNNRRAGRERRSGFGRIVGD